MKKQVSTPSITVPDDLIGMGYVAGAFGVRGWVKIRANTEYLDALFDYSQWWLKKQQGWKAYHLIEGAIHTKALIAKFEGIDDRDSAELLRGSEIAISRALMPEPEEDSYYWNDLIGLTVVNKVQAPLGKVVRLLETGANDVLVVEDKGKEHLIPFVGAIVHKVDLVARTIEVDWDVDYLKR